MDHIDINYLLKKNGSSQAKIARKLGITRGAVCLVLKGKGESRRIKRAIAKIIGKKVSEIWPDAA